MQSAGASNYFYNLTFPYTLVARPSIFCEAVSTNGSIANRLLLRSRVCKVSVSRLVSLLCVVTRLDFISGNRAESFVDLLGSFGLFFHCDIMVLFTTILIISRVIFCSDNSLFTALSQATAQNITLHSSHLS